MICEQGMAGESSCPPPRFKGRKRYMNIVYRSECIRLLEQIESGFYPGSSVGRFKIGFSSNCMDCNVDIHRS